MVCCYEKEHFMRKILVCFLLAILLVGGLGVFAYHRYNNPVELKASVGLGQEQFDGTSSTFQCNVNIKNKNYDFGLVATDFTYIVTFRGKDGLTLHEVLITPDVDICEEDYTVTLTFGEGGDYEAIAGEVKKAEIRIESASYENSSVYRVANGGEKYELKLVWHIIECVLTLVFAFCVFLEFAVLFDDGWVRMLLRGLLITAYLVWTYTSFLAGPMAFIIPLLA